MKILSGIAGFVEFLFWVLLFLCLLLIGLNYFSQQPYFPLNVRLLVVRSGSMEPTIMTGDAIVIRQSQNYGKDDIITFYDPRHTIVTHRVLETILADTQVKFQTKGDNNQAADPEPISGSAIIGKWWFTIPFLGYGLVYAHSVLGASIVISIIVGLLISEQVWKYLKRQQLPSTDQATK